MKPTTSTFTAAKPRHVAILGNYPPRRCGIATFTQDNYLALKDARPEMMVDLYVMDDGAVETYPAEVKARLPEGDLLAYRRLAEEINDSGAEALWLQHEFGIFGGEAGSHILALLDRLTLPYAVMLHTVLEHPNADQRHVFERILDGAAAIVVMAEKGREILSKVYGIASDRVSRIPHGVPDRPFESTSQAKTEIGQGEDAKLILSFGLLSPDKGLEDMIAAMPDIVAACPSAHYLILGQTHPNLVRQEGEAYRERLRALSLRLGVQDQVSFINEFVALNDLTRYLAAADIYVTPYRGAQQVTSGTLSYAVGLGKPVVSTPYVHAQEILADDHGVLVPFGDTAALATAVAELLNNDQDRLALARRAYARGRTMIWSKFAEALLSILSELQAPIAARIPARADPIEPKIEPLDRLTDDVGMVQHAVFSIAHRDHGYCIDDNARALMLMSLAHDLPFERRMALSRTYAAFVQQAWNEDEGRYRNFMGYDRRWLEPCGSPDSNGRTLWAMGATAAHHPDALLRRWATQHFDRAASYLGELTSPRTVAFCALGAIEMLAAHPNHARALFLLQRAGDRLVAGFGAASRPGWRWLESRLAYDNARLPEALIRVGMALKRADCLDAGFAALAWLRDIQTAPGGCFRPVGTLSFGQDHVAPQIFDQQPLEAWATIDACEAAWRAGHDRLWIDHAKAARDWFLGVNDLGQTLISPETGDCHDGLTPVGVNLNSGAESVLAWQFAVRAYDRLTAAVDASRRTAIG